jgi:hypothetical protein
MVKYHEGSDLFSLARFSLIGGQHAADCQYYARILRRVAEAWITSE